MTTESTRISSAAAQAEALAFARMLDYGILEIRTGRQPERVDDDATGEVLARLRFGSPAGGAEDGVIVFSRIETEGLATGSGDAGWFRAYSASRAPVWDGSVGVDEGATLRMPSTRIRRGGRVIIMGATYRIEKG